MLNRHRTPVTLVPLLFSAAAYAQPATTATDAPVGSATGTALEIRLQTGDVPLSDGSSMPVTEGGAFLGYHWPRMTIGVGVAFRRVASSAPSSFGTVATTTAVVLPGAQFSLARASDGRVELFGAIDAGLGRTWFSASGGSPAAPIRSVRLQIGPGFRFWASPSFAVGASTGLRYEYFGDVGTRAMSITTWTTSLHLTAVF